MATVPSVAYLGDTNEYVDWCSKWSAPYFHRLSTFEEGPIGGICQRNLSGLNDGFDSRASGSTYSDEVLFEGRQVCKMHAPTGSVGQLSFGGSFEKDVLARRGQTVWSQATLYLPSDKWDLEEVMAGGGGWKLLRTQVSGVGHADLYFNAVGLNPDKPLYVALEAHTSTVSGHSTHNSKTNIGDRSVWDIPRDQWVDFQLCVHYDIGHYEEARTRVLVWHGDTLVADLTPTPNRHAMINDYDEMDLTDLCTYINANYNPPSEYDPNKGPHGVTKPQTWYCAAYEVTSKTPEYTDAHGNPKLPPRAQL